jgi:polysaccharide biosynthesis transport protein
MTIDVNRGVQGNKVVGFTSSTPEEGKFTTSTAVALLAAQANARVILIDGDLRIPSLSRRLAPRAMIGILEVISGNASLDDAICRDPVTNGLFAGRLEVGFGEFQRTPCFRRHEEFV